MKESHKEPLGELSRRSPSRRTVLTALLGSAGAAVLSSCAAAPRPESLQTAAGHTAEQTTGSAPPAVPAAAPVPSGTAGPAAGLLPASHFIQRGPVTRPTVAVTVDDFFAAAGADYLQGLLSLAQQKQVPFTFFPTGRALDDHAALGRADLWKQAVADGHVIGNHTYRHLLPKGRSGAGGFAALSPADRQRELDQSRQALNNVLGFPYEQVLMRPPGGSGGFPEQKDHPATLATVAAAGYYMTMWTTDSNTPKGKMTSPDEDDRFLTKILTDPRQKAQNGSIILVHPTTLSLGGMARLLDALAARQLTCRTVPGLFAS